MTHWLARSFSFKGIVLATTFLIITASAPQVEAIDPPEETQLEPLELADLVAKVIGQITDNFILHGVSGNMFGSFQGQLTPIGVVTQISGQNGTGSTQFEAILVSTGSQTGAFEFVGSAAGMSFSGEGGFNRFELADRAFTNVCGMYWSPQGLSRIDTLSATDLFRLRGQETLATAGSQIFSNMEEGSQSKLVQAGKFQVKKGMGSGQISYIQVPTESETPKQITINVSLLRIERTGPSGDFLTVEGDGQFF